MKTSLVATTATVFCVACSCVFAQDGGIGGRIQADFERLVKKGGGQSTATAPGGYRGQQMNTYTGGSLMARFPTETVQVSALALPSIDAGCGGIDIVGGSLSFMNLDRVTDLLKNIGTSTVGFAFQVALDSLSSLIGANVKHWLDQVQKMTALNINSCEVAQAAVGGIANQFMQSQQSACEAVVRALPGMDAAKARDECRDPAKAKEYLRTLNTANAQQTPLKNVAWISGNLVWDALDGMKVTGADGTTAPVPQWEKELIMSMTGTVILNPDAPASDPNKGLRAPPPIIKSVQHFMFGDDPDPAPLDVSAIINGHTPTVGLTLYTCADNRCMDPKPQLRRMIIPFQAHVARMLKGISENIRTSNPPTPEQISFINMTHLPVYRLLAAASSSPGGAMPDVIINQYTDLIALDHADRFLSKILEKADAALKQHGGRDANEVQAINLIRANIAARRSEIGTAMANEKGKLKDISDVYEHIQKLERSMWGSGAGSVAFALGYSSGGTTPIPGAAKK